MRRCCHRESFFLCGGELSDSQHNDLWVRRPAGFAASVRMPPLHRLHSFSDLSGWKHYHNSAGNGGHRIQLTHSCQKSAFTIFTEFSKHSKHHDVENIRELHEMFCK